MTRDKALHMAIVMTAYAEGAEVQYLNRSGVWTDVADPMFNFRDDYRVKPEPREIWMVDSTNGGSALSDTYRTATEAYARHQRCIDPEKWAVRGYREITDE